MYGRKVKAAMMSAEYDEEGDEEKGLVPRWRCHGTNRYQARSKTPKGIGLENKLDHDGRTLSKGVFRHRQARTSNETVVGGPLSYTKPLSL